jgi:hypothetical protein
MNIPDWLHLGKTVAEPIKAVGDLYTTDKARIEAEAKYEEIAQKPRMGQIENNKLLILTGKVFNLGWMALLGWTCGFLVLLYYAPQILIITYVWGSDCIHTGVVNPFPMNSDEILNLVYLIFGMGGLGVVKNKLK